MSKNRITIISILIFIFLSLFPIFKYYGISNGDVLYLTIGLIAVSSVIYQDGPPKRYLIFLFIMLLCSSITSLYWKGNIRILLYPLIMLTGLYLSLYLSERCYDTIVIIFTIFSIIMLIGAYVGFVYAMLGGKAIFEIKNPDGRNNGFYLATFSNAKILRIIRPSGFFDEPGAFSFYLCITALMRTITKRSKKVTWLILLLGFITISLAHLIYVIMQLLSEKYNSKKNVKTVIILFIAIGLIISTTSVGNAIFVTMYKRLPFTEKDDNVYKDTRSGLIANCIENLDLKSFFFSADPSLMDPSLEPQKELPYLGDNPLSPILQYGFLISWPFYFYLALLLVIGFKKRENIIFFGLALLLAQRPNIFNIGYSSLSLLPTIIYIRMVTEGNVGSIITLGRCRKMMEKQC